MSCPPNWRTYTYVRTDCYDSHLMSVVVVYILQLFYALRTALANRAMTNEPRYHIQHASTSVSHVGQGATIVDFLVAFTVCVCVYSCFFPIPHTTWWTATWTHNFEIGDETAGDELNISYKWHTSMASKNNQKPHDNSSDSDTRKNNNH